MSLTLDHLLKKNADWSRNRTTQDPDFFSKLVNQQSPDYLWIGCSDSRVPANDIFGLMPGELFVQRNVANIVYAEDLNCQSVVEHAVDILRGRHVIVCGHYGCGGVRAALDHRHHGLIDHWLTSIKDVYLKNKHAVDRLPDEATRLNRMCELNVNSQVQPLSHTCGPSRVAMRAGAQSAWLGLWSGRRPREGPQSFALGDVGNGSDLSL